MPAALARQSQTSMQLEFLKQTAMHSPATRVKPLPMLVNGWSTNTQQADRSSSKGAGTAA